MEELYPGTKLVVVVMGVGRSHWRRKKAVALVGCNERHPHFSFVAGGRQGA